MGGFHATSKTTIIVSYCGYPSHRRTSRGGWVLKRFLSEFLLTNGKQVFTLSKAQSKRPLESSDRR